MLICQEIEKFKNILFHEQLYIRYSIRYTVFEVKYLKADLFLKKNIKIY